jgi:hypothetical protein
MLLLEMARRAIKPVAPRKGNLKMINTRIAIAVATSLFGLAALVGLFATAPAPASADPSPSDTQPNPFASLTCSCQGTPPAGGPALSAELDRGLWKGLSS